MTSNGGPAFPVLEEYMKPVFDGAHEVKVEHMSQGMSLRDYFAARAMAAIIQCPHTERWMPDHIAGQAYFHADAMLAARDGGKDD